MDKRDLNNLFKSPADWIATAIIVAVLVGFCANKSWETGVLMFTAIIILWYSWETHAANKLAGKTRAEMVIANQLTLQPCLVLEYIEPGKFLLKNIGRGSAINIRVETGITNYTLKLRNINALKSGEEREVVLHKNGQRLGTEDNDHLAQTPLTIKIFFERTKKLSREMFTEIEIKDSPNIRIINKYWGPPED